MFVLRIARIYLPYDFLTAVEPKSLLSYQPHKDNPEVGDQALTRSYSEAGSCWHHKRRDDGLGVLEKC